MVINLNGFQLTLSLHCIVHSHWIPLPLALTHSGAAFSYEGLSGQLLMKQSGDDQIDYKLEFKSPWQSRLRLSLSLADQADLFHLIPGVIFGDNNAAHVRPGEFPCLSNDNRYDRARSTLWELRADRASHPVSILCCNKGAAGIMIDPYSDDSDANEGFIRNGVFSGLPNVFGVSLGYGNSPMTFEEKTSFHASTFDLSRSVSASGSIFGIDGNRLSAHTILRRIHGKMRTMPTFTKTDREALRALADTFANVNYSKEHEQYTNRKCQVPTNLEMKPWRAVVEIGWTGGSMMAYPFVLAEKIFNDLKMPKSGEKIFDEICSGHNPKSGLIFDTVINRYTKNRMEGWNASEINGWWSGFMAHTRDAHTAYTNAHVAYYLLRTLTHPKQDKPYLNSIWVKSALSILDTAIELQREDGAFGYIFSATEKKVTDFEGFAGCWFAAALPIAWKITGDEKYKKAAERAIDYYAKDVRNIMCWGSPMDTYKSVDSEGNLAFLRATRLMHEYTGEKKYLDLAIDSANYEYVWRYCFASRPQYKPLKGSNWNSCGGTITSVSNPHLHPMGVVATDDLEYLARVTGDDYHQQRADEGMSWIKNTMELYPDVMGYGCYGLLSERSCPSDGVLNERYADTGAPSSTWWSYNAWAAASAMEALAERIIAREKL